MRLFDVLDAAGVAHRTVEHAAVFTVPESGLIRHSMPGLHCKNLFLRPARGEHPFCLATLKEDRAVSVNALARAARAIA